MPRTLRTLRSLARVVRRDPGFAALTLLAWSMLVVTRGVVVVIPLRRIAAHLGTPRRETTTETLSGGRFGGPRRIRRAIHKAVPHTPTQSNCYPQALTATLLLRASRLPSTMYYGAAFAEDGSGLETHVWVRSGLIFVTGAPEHQCFAPVAAFAWTPPGDAHGTVEASFEPPPSATTTADGGAARNGSGDPREPGQ